MAFQVGNNVIVKVGEYRGKHDSGGLYCPSDMPVDGTTLTIIKAFVYGKKNRYYVRDGKYTYSDEILQSYSKTKRLLSILKEFK